MDDMGAEELPDCDIQPQLLSNLFRHTDHDRRFDIHESLQKHRLPQKNATEIVTNSNQPSDKDDDWDPGETLNFDCRFESGNVASVVNTVSNEFDVRIRTDTRNDRHAVWFYFRISGDTKPGRSIRLHFANYSKPNRLFKEGFTPVIRSKSRPIWVRLRPDRFSYFRCDRHRRMCFVVQLFFETNRYDEYFIAYAFPYSYSFLQRTLLELTLKPWSGFTIQRQCIARSIRQRRIDCLTIKSENSDSNKPCIVLSSRVHPGETVSSFVMHGLLEFLVSNHPSAIQLRQQCDLYVIPMLNTDGVYCGNHRCNSIGLDLNREWLTPDWTRHPAISAVKYLVRKLDSENRLHFYVDFHGHTNSTEAFMYCNEPSMPVDSPEGSTEFASILPRLWAYHCPDYSLSKTKFCSNPKKAGSARRAVQAVLNNPTALCYTFEVSFWQSSSQLLTKEAYKNIGRCFIHSLGEMYSIRDPKERSLFRSFNFQVKRPLKGKKLGLTNVGNNRQNAETQQNSAQS